LKHNTQVGEYKGQIGTKEYGHLLFGIATEYNNALLSSRECKYWVGYNYKLLIERGYSKPILFILKVEKLNADSYFNEYIRY
jgi:hypothetical protein